MLLFANNARSTLRASITAASPVLYIEVGTGELFPEPVAGDSFLATLQDASGRVEVIEVRHRSGDQFEQVLRGVDGTTAKSFAEGSTVSMRVTAELLRRISADTMRGSYDGVAPLDSNGLVPLAYLPATVINEQRGDARYTRISELGKPNQPPSLNASGVLADAVVPDTIMRTAVAQQDYVRKADYGQPNGAAQLGADGKLPAGAIPFANPDLTPYAVKLNAEFTGNTAFNGSLLVAGGIDAGNITSSALIRAQNIEVAHGLGVTGNILAGGLQLRGGAVRGKLTVSTAPPSGAPADGDEWYQVT